MSATSSPRKRARSISARPKPRGIYGEATLDEAKSLAEDGVGFMPIPVFPEDRN